MKKTLLFITRSAIIAALYFVLSVVAAPISFGPIQFRISEVLVLLPIILPESIIGLTLGCFLSNFFFSTIYDAIIGTLATFLAAVITFLLRKNFFLSAIPPILLNSLLVPLIWLVDSTFTIYLINFGTILASELIICGIIGVPFTICLKKALLSARIIKPISSKYDSQPYRFIDWNNDLNEDD